MTLAGREIMFRRAKLGQILILNRVTQRMIGKAEGDPQDQGKALMSAVVKTLDFVDKLILDEDDRQFVEDQMMEGTIDYLDILKALGGKGDQTPDDEEPKLIKRPPKRSPKAAPVDLSDKRPAQVVPKATKATSRARTKR